MCWRTSNRSSLLIYRPREDERLSWPGWLTYSGRLTHISGHLSTTGRAQGGERKLARDWNSTAELCGPSGGCLWICCPSASVPVYIYLHRFCVYVVSMHPYTLFIHSYPTHSYLLHKDPQPLCIVYTLPLCFFDRAYSHRMYWLPTHSS